MAIGPVEYIIVGFPGNKFNGEIAPELGKLVESGTIRILDLVFITKDADGEVRAVEFEDHDDVALFNALEGEVGGLISDEDIEYAATELEPNSSAALLIWEDLWAAPFVDRDARLRRRAHRGLAHPARPDRSRREPPLAARRLTRTRHTKETTTCCDVDHWYEPLSRPRSWPAPPPGRGTASSAARSGGAADGGPDDH